MDGSQSLEKFTMAPRKKRRRRTVADSGLGASLRDNEGSAQKKEIVDGPESISPRKEQEFIRETVNCTGERNMESKDGNASAGKDCGSQENIGGSPEVICLPEAYSSPEELNVTAESASLIPATAKELYTPEQSICDSPERNCSPEIPCGVPVGVTVSVGSTSSIPVTTEETVNSPEKNVPHLQLKSTISDFGSDSTVTGSSRSLNFTPQPTDNVAIGNECREESNNGQASICSRETEILLGIEQILETRESFCVDDLHASQESRKSTKESDPKELVNVTEPKSTDNVQFDHSPPMDRYNCSADIDTHRQAVPCQNQMLPKVVVLLPAEELSLQSTVDFQPQYPISPEVQINNENSVGQESAELTEHHNKDGHTEKGNALTQPSSKSLSVWSEAHSEYFPSAKPSNLGELCDIAARCVVRAWVKSIRPSISGSPLNLVKKFCPECHRKYQYNEDIDDHLCSKSRSGSNSSLKLIYYAELEIYDETHEMLRVALTGIQAIKLFGCKPEEFIQNTQIQKKVWNAFRHLVKGGNTQNWCLKDSADFSLEPHLKGKEMNCRVVDIRPFGPKFK